MNLEKIYETADEIIELYHRYGNTDYIGEPVSQIEHMCQCAILAEEEGRPADVILAAFLHDIGHLCEYIYPKEEIKHMDNCGIMDHEYLGAEYLLSKGFSVSVVKMVGSHVNAKRYLTYRYPEYYNQLSEASKKTLEHQGGMMTPQEATIFEAEPLFNEYIALRKWDDIGKMQHVPVPSLDRYREMIIAHLSNQKIGTK